MQKQTVAELEATLAELRGSGRLVRGGVVGKKRLCAVAACQSELNTVAASELTPGLAAATGAGRPSATDG